MLLLIQFVFGVVALAVVLFVAFPYRGRSVPRAERISGAVAAVADRVDPGEAPVEGILTTPAKSRKMARRFERAERKVRRGARALTMVRSSG